MSRIRWAGLALYIFTVLGALGCGSDDPPPIPPPPPTELSVQIVDRVTQAVVTDAWVRIQDRPWTLVNDGRLQLEVAPGTYDLSVAASGYLLFPSAFDASVTVTVVAETLTEVTLRLDAKDMSGPSGVLRGTVDIDDVRSNIAVIASGAIDVVGYSDATGSFVITNVPPGVYTVRGVFSGHRSSEVAGLTVTAGQTVGDVNVALTPGGTARIQGQLQGGQGATELTLTTVGSSRPIPSLNVVALADGNWVMEGVPPGRYQLRYGLEPDDGWVANPEDDRRAPLVVDIDTEPVTQDLVLGAAIDGLSPTDTASVSQTPTFSWAAVDGADFYVAELRTMEGQGLWGGFDASGNWRTQIFETSISYDGPALTVGQRYRWRVFAARQDPLLPAAFTLFAASEVQAVDFVVTR